MFRRLGKVNELVRTAHFERSNFWFLQGLRANFDGDMFGRKISLWDAATIPPQLAFLVMRNKNLKKILIIVVVVVVVFILSYFFPVRVDISVSLQPDFVISLLFLLFLFLSIFFRFVCFVFLLVKATVPLHVATCPFFLEPPLMFTFLIYQVGAPPPLSFPFIKLKATIILFLCKGFQLPHFKTII